MTTNKMPIDRIATINRLATTISWISKFRESIEELSLSPTKHDAFHKAMVEAMEAQIEDLLSEKKMLEEELYEDQEEQGHNH